MDFTFSADQVQLRLKARAFAEREIAPMADELDAAYDYHAGGVERIKRSGLYAYVVPEAYGGKGISSVNLCILREELAKVSTFADEVFVMQGLGSNPIVRFGNEAQKRKYLPPLLDGSRMANFCLTEPAAGSDVAGIEATARREGNDYVLNGRKCYVSKPEHTDISVVFAKTRPEAGAKGISAFIVDREQSSYGVKTEKLMFEGDIGEITLRDTRVPVENLLGEEGQGMGIALGNLDIYRPTVGAAALGMGRRALSLALDHARNRRMFRQALVDFQVTRFKLAQMKVELDAASLLIYRAAWMADQSRERPTMEASIAKYFATEAAQRVVDQSLQLHGGIGIHKRSRIEHLYRAIRALRIYEGTSEIQLLVIGRELLRGGTLEHDDRL
ncbi:MAG: acyl-CoA dehydrogenase family protein [Deltaproteobacteria bacterium]|nr:acyl-CoA dehydrogenase family protein [Deltaproteobacteria bacterium]